MAPLEMHPAETRLVLWKPVQCTVMGSSLVLQSPSAGSAVHTVSQPLLTQPLTPAASSNRRVARPGSVSCKASSAAARYPLAPGITLPAAPSTTPTAQPAASEVLGASVVAAGLLSDTLLTALLLLVAAAEAQAALQRRSTSWWQLRAEASFTLPAASATRCR